MAFFNKIFISDTGDRLKEANIEVEKILAEVTPPFPQEKKEEGWIWVEGYKGTEEDMTCRGLQYEIGKEYSLPENLDPILCEAGFHLCLKLGDVFKYYNIGYNHRFFKVKALVEEKAVKEQTSDRIYWSPSSRPDKLVAKSIIFIEELSIDEIFKDTNIADFPLEYKEFALKNGTEKAEKKFVKDKLTTAYGDKLAYYIVEREGIHASELAYALADNNDLALYEKLLLIFNKGK